MLRGFSNVFLPTRTVASAALKSFNTSQFLKVYSRSLSTAVPAAPSSSSSSNVYNEKLVVAKKTNIGQSPLKMKFLLRLVRGEWMPEALAQMKFSPKHRAEDVAKILRVSKVSYHIPICRIQFCLISFSSSFYREHVLLRTTITMPCQKN